MRLDRIPQVNVATVDLVDVRRFGGWSGVRPSWGLSLLAVVRVVLLLPDPLPLLPHLAVFG